MLKNFQKPFIFWDSEKFSFNSQQFFRPRYIYSSSGSTLCLHMQQQCVVGLFKRSCILPMLQKQSCQQKQQEEKEVCLATFNLDPAGYQSAVVQNAIAVCPSVRWVPAHVFFSCFFFVNYAAMYECICLSCSLASTRLTSDRRRLLLAAILLFVLAAYTHSHYRASYLMCMLTTHEATRTSLCLSSMIGSLIDANQAKIMDSIIVGVAHGRKTS